MTPDLPDELIVEIISRMHPRNALELCCLSKNLYSTLTSEYFCSLHLHNWRSYRATSRFWRHSLGLNEEDFSLIARARIKSLLRCPRDCCRTYGIAGIINGVVCLQSCKAIQWIFLWNPIIKRRLLIPSPPRPPAVHQPFSKQSLGFAYDYKRNDYKIFSIWTEFDNKGPISVKPVLYVFSTKKGEWAKVQHKDESKVVVVNDSWAAFLKGSCHWGVYGQRSGVCWQRCLVLAVDARDYSISLYEMPDAMQLNMIERMTVGVANGCLALIPWAPFSQRDGNESIVWVMKEYGNASSWIQRYRVVGEVSRFIWVGAPLLTKSGELLKRGLAFRNEEGLEEVFLPHHTLYPHTFTGTIQLLGDGHQRICFCPHHH